MQEIWKPVVGYEGHYEVSNLGQVRSIKKKPLIMKQRLNPDGRMQVNLSKGVQKSFKVHLLVARAFHGVKPDGLVIRHLDGDCLNNNSDNLAYGTDCENAEDAIKHETHVCISRRKLTDDEVRFIRQRTIGCMKASQMFGCSQTTILRIQRGETYKHVS